ncbi:MAG: hypothetical protein AAF404_13630 [Pseudomonadota bacterium]
MNHIRPIYLATALMLIGGCAAEGVPPEPSPETPPENVACNDVHIVNLSQDSRSGYSCLMADTKEGIANCVEQGIRSSLPAACAARFDIFVPGTAAEHGSWKQFNSMFSKDTGRGYSSPLRSSTKSSS